MIEQAARTTIAQLEDRCAAESSKSVACLRRCSAIEDEARTKMLEMTVQHGNRFDEMAVAVAGSQNQAALNFGLEAKLAEAHSRNEQPLLRGPVVNFGQQTGKSRIMSSPWKA